MNQWGQNRRSAARMRKRSRRGFTLLEVILALAVLAVAMAALGEVLRSASDSGRRARDLTQAQLIASSKMAELTSGVMLLDIINGAPVEEVNSYPPWIYSVNYAQTPEIGLVSVEVTVTQDLDASENPISFTLVRWMTDPAAVTTTDTTGTAGDTSGTGGGV